MENIVHIAFKLPISNMVVENCDHTISGQVKNMEGLAIVDAKIYFKKGPVALPDIAVLTNQTGHFSLSFPSAGTYVIECTADGFISKTLTITSREQQPNRVEITLQKA